MGAFTIKNEHVVIYNYVQEVLENNSELNQIARNVVGNASNLVYVVTDMYHEGIKGAGADEGDEVEYMTLGEYLQAQRYYIDTDTLAEQLGVSARAENFEVIANDNSFYWDDEADKWEKLT